MSASKYKNEYCKQLIDFMSDGYSYESFSAHIGVVKSTLYDWEKLHPEWASAKKLAFAEAKKYFEKRLHAKTLGQKVDGINPKLVDTSCLIFALKTRFHETYGDKSKITHEVEAKTLEQIVKDKASKDPLTCTKQLKQ